MAEHPDLTVRIKRSDWKRIGWAFAISIILHAVIYGSYEAGQRLGWWQNLQLPAWLNPAKQLAALTKSKTDDSQKNQEVEVELPLTFVDVSSSQATPEAPKESPYYSDKNSKAANPDTKADTATPKIDGHQIEIVKTEDVPREKMFPLQPAAPPQPTPPPPDQQPNESEQPEIKPKRAEAHGDLAMAKPADKPVKAPPREDDAPPQPPKLPKPMTVKEALARLPKPESDTRPGRKMEQNGGVRHFSLQSSLDVRATTFGLYDAKVIQAVQERWDMLLENRLWARDHFGKVSVRFQLHSDGTVTQMDLTENTVDLSLALLCQSAIRDNAPYDPWPDDMKRKVGASYREITFTFYYN
jgi:hypothetical protein